MRKLKTNPKGNKTKKLVIRKINSIKSIAYSQSKGRFLAKETVLRDPQSILPNNMAHQT